ncbi:MAG: ATP-binding cassette domain-containing protein [Acidipropionibacterium sp.]|nr:ATP-binding cassette domain-containing protein [Acidipropionibacterium sp.]
MTHEDTVPSSPHAAGSEPRRPPVITLRHARVRSEDALESERALLDIEQLDLYPGDRVVVTGPSGAGKSMLLSTLTGRWAVGLRFTGERIPHFSRIGFIPQRGLDALHPLVPLGGQLGRVTGQSTGRVAEVLDAVGLTDPAVRRRRPTEISGGQAQRAAVALAVLTRAPLILADEPTSALDHTTRDQTLALLDRVIEPSQTLVVVTHDPAVADALATRRLAIDSGRITEIGPAPRTAAA